MPKKAQGNQNGRVMISKTSILKIDDDK